MLEVRLMGTFAILFGGKPVTLSSRRAESLFAYLILTAGTLHRREKLAGMFWPDEPEEKARAYLRNALWLIRKTLHDQSKVEYILADDLVIGFNHSSEFWLDITEFKNASETATTEELIYAISLFQGEFLPGFYEDWTALEREHLQALYAAKVARVLELLEKEKRWSEILKWAEHWISLDNGPEAAYRALLIAYDALGDRTKVSLTYQRCVQALRELSLEPSEETRSLAFKRAHKLNIPLPLTSFIGRIKELKVISDLISKSRLVTLTGSGGVGKTRLAIQVSMEVLDLFPDGVWFLDLAPLNDPTLIPGTLANLLGLQQSSITELSTTDLLINYFRSRKALIIFDNSEHLIEACAQLINLLLSSCENLSILATSREVLRISGEIPYRVPSLETPVLNNDITVDVLTNLDSVRLFIDRAKLFVTESRLRNISAIAEICQRLDGIPLAIELAAARVNILRVEEILKQLENSLKLLTDDNRTTLPRHQTLRASLDWSWGLLSEIEKKFLRQLSVFAGGWSLEAAQAVCDGEALNLTSVLAKKSLIMVEQDTGPETRYRFHDIVCQYVREKLVETGEEIDFRTRHLKFFLQLSKQAEPALRGPQQVVWYKRFMVERDNLRAALEWADKTDVEAGLSLTEGLDRFWKAFDVREEARWLAKFVQKPESEAFPLPRAKALLALAWASSYTDEYSLSHADGQVQECLNFFRALGNREGEIDSLLLLGYLRFSLGSRPENDFIHEALTLAQSIGDVWRQASALDYLGQTTGVEQRFHYWDLAIKLFRQMGDWDTLVNVLSFSANFLILNGDFELAQKRLDEATLLNDQLQDKPVKASILYAFAQMAKAQGNYTQAREFWQEGLAILEEVGADATSLWYRLQLGHLTLREGKAGESGDIFWEAARQFQKDQNHMGLPFSLEGMAGWYSLVGKHLKAARLIGWADATRKKFKDPRPLFEQVDIDKIIAACIAQMGQIAFSTEYDKGERMALDELIT